MTSTLRSESTTRSEPEPTVPAASIAAAPAPAAAPAVEVARDDSDRDAVVFGRAVLLGAATGIPVLGGLMALLMWVVAPTTAPAAILTIAVWVGLFCGPFLGGTVTVGLASRH